MNMQFSKIMGTFWFLKMKQDLQSTFLKNLWKIWWVRLSRLKLNQNVFLYLHVNQSLWEKFSKNLERNMWFVSAKRKKFLIKHQSSSRKRFTSASSTNERVCAKHSIILFLRFEIYSKTMKHRNSYCWSRKIILLNANFQKLLWKGSFKN